MAEATCWKCKSITTRFKTVCWGCLDTIAELEARLAEAVRQRTEARALADEYKAELDEKRSELRDECEMNAQIEAQRDELCPKVLELETRLKVK